MKCVSDTMVCFPCYSRFGSKWYLIPFSNCLCAQCSSYENPCCFFLHFCIHFIIITVSFRLLSPFSLHICTYTHIFFAYSPLNFYHCIHLLLLFFCFSLPYEMIYIFYEPRAHHSLSISCSFYLAHIKRIQCKRITIEA